MAEESAAALVRGSPPADDGGLSADAFRGLETAFEDAQVQHATDVETAAVTQRRERVKALIDQHIDDTKWRTLLHQARQVAERGEEGISAAPLSKRAVHGRCARNQQSAKSRLAEHPSGRSDGALCSLARSTETSWVPPRGARP